MRVTNGEPDPCSQGRTRLSDRAGALASGSARMVGLHGHDAKKSSNPVRIRSGHLADPLSNLRPVVVLPIQDSSGLRH